MVCTLQFLAALSNTDGIPRYAASRPHAFDGASVQIGISHRSQVEFPYTSEEVEALVCFLDHSVNEIGPGQIVNDIYTTEGI